MLWMLFRELQVQILKDREGLQANASNLILTTCRFLHFQLPLLHKKGGIGEVKKPQEKERS